MGLLLPVRLDFLLTWNTTQFGSNPVSGGKPSNAIDQRVVVHLQSFGYSTPNAANHLKFRTDITDMWGMPMVSVFFIGMALKGTDSTSRTSLELSKTRKITKDRKI